MEYKINHLTLIEPSRQQPFFEQAIDEKVNRFRHFLKDYPKKLLLEIFIKKEGARYVVTASLALRAKFLYAEEKGSEALQVAEQALGKLKSLVKKQLGAERKEYLYNRKYRSHALAENSRPLLEQFVTKGEAGSFVTSIQEAIPELNQYIRNEIYRQPVLRYLVRSGRLGKLEMIEEVYHDLYQQLRDDPDQPEKMIIWAYGRSDKKIRSMVEQYREQTAKLGYAVWSQQQEEEEERADRPAYSGLLASFRPGSDETFFNPGEYQLHEILTDAGAREDILGIADPDDEDQFIRKTLRSFLIEQQSAFELYYLHRFRIDEIARIKNLPENQVERGLREIRTRILNNTESEVEHYAGTAHDQV
ncbi:MAG TPA: hypothetical protein VMI35_14645 [Puia sp.]|nr:hypothetical protein [Puia sp.]